MNTKQSLILMCIGIAIVSIFIFLSFPKQVEIPHYHAGFLVYIDGQKQDYADTQYMYLDSCTVIDKQKNHTMETPDKVHLHNDVGDVAHVHDDTSTWALLFKNIEINFPPNEPLVGYKNGEKIDNLINMPIKPYDSVIFIIGSEDGIDKTQYVTQAHIQDVEGKSSVCNR
ncbi:MAG: hypothetical protein NTZ55_04600 [Candidatus Roizmanbacteria bacterium]|nr:hypothetical protein [Candidatus Roizmanbacteria bacterium]